MQLFVTIVAIALCGGIGGVAGWALVTSLGLSGVVAAIIAARVGMAIATGLWVGLTSVLRALGLMR
jgi:hypothetical protein